MDSLNVMSQLERDRQNSHHLLVDLKEIPMCLSHLPQRNEHCSTMLCWSKQSNTQSKEDKYQNAQSIVARNSLRINWTSTSVALVFDTLFLESHIETERAIPAKLKISINRLSLGIK